MSDSTERPDSAPSPSEETPAPGPTPATEAAAPAAEPERAAPPPAPPAAEVPAPSPPPPPATEAAAPAAEPKSAATPPAPTAPEVPAPSPPPATEAAAPAAEPVRAAPPPRPPAPAFPAPSPPPATAVAAAAPPSSFFERVKRVFNFETGVYPEVAADGQAAIQAIVVIVVATLFAGSIWSLFIFFITVPFALAATALSAGLVSFSASLFNKESPGFAAWFRALGFAEAPLALGILPLIGSFIGLVYWIATSVAAIHRVARVPVGVAILVWVLAWLLPLLFLAFLAFLFGGLAIVGSLVSDLG